MRYMDPLGNFRRGAKHPLKTPSGRTAFCCSAYAETGPVATHDMLAWGFGQESIFRSWRFSIQNLRMTTVLSLKNERIHLYTRMCTYKYIHIHTASMFSYLHTSVYIYIYKHTYMRHVVRVRVRSLASVLVIEPDGLHLSSCSRSPSTIFNSQC